MGSLTPYGVPAKRELIIIYIFIYILIYIYIYNSFIDIYSYLEYF